MQKGLIDYLEPFWAFSDIKDCIIEFDKLVPEINNFVPVFSLCQVANTIK